MLVRKSQFIMMTVLAKEIAEIKSASGNCQKRISEALLNFKFYKI